MATVNPLLRAAAVFWILGWVGGWQPRSSFQYADDGSVVNPVGYRRKNFSIAPS